MRPQIGDVIGAKWRLVRHVGDGGMGSVWEARHERLGTAVALKFLHPEIARRPGLAQRFLREAQVAATIRSAHVVQVSDVDQTPDGTAYLVMELVAGTTLHDLIEQQRRLPREVALEYALQMLAGLDAAHACGVVHRDLKPENVLVSATPQGPVLKLLDFGIAKLRLPTDAGGGLTRPGVLMGTPEYMAPEQVDAAEAVDARADLYAAGAMLYEMLTGRRPVAGEDPRAIAARVRARQVTPIGALDPTIPEPLASLVHRAMAPNPAERFASARAMRDALLPWCTSLSPATRSSISTPPPTTNPAAPAAWGQTSQMPAWSPPQPEAARTVRAAPYAPAPQGGSTPAAYGGTPPPVAPVDRGRWSLGVLAGLAGAALAISLTAFFAARAHDEERASPIAAPITPVAIPVPTAEPVAVPPAPTVTTTTPAQPVAPPPAPATTHAAPPPSGGAHPPAQPDAGAAGWPPLPTAFPFPSSLPPIPTAIPGLPFPLPSSLPPLPPLPGWPAPASSR